MTIRRKIDQRRRELQAALIGRLANRAFTRKTTGVDGFAKRMLAKQAPPIEHDPDLDHPDVEVEQPSTRDDS